MKSSFAIIAILLLLPIAALPQSKEAKQLYNQGVALCDEENYAEALTYLKKSDSLYKAQLKPSSKKYYNAEIKMAECYDGLACYYCDVKCNYAEAIRLQTMVTDIYLRAYGENNTDYAVAISDLADYYATIGNYSESLKLSHKALKILESTAGKESEEYIVSLNNLANAYNGTDNYSEGYKLLTTVTDLSKKHFGEESFYYMVSLNNLAYINFAIRNYSESIKQGNKVLEIAKKLYGDSHPTYARLLNNQAQALMEIGNYAEAINYQNTALNIQKEKLGEEHAEYAETLQALAWLYYLNKNYSKAITVGTRATEIRKKLFGEHNVNYAISIANLADYYAQTGKYNEAINLAQNALNIINNVLGEKHLQTYSTQNLLAGYYLNSGNYDKSAEYFKQSYKNARAYVLNNFASMTTKERSNFWKNLSFIRDRLPYAAYRIATTKGISSKVDSTLSSLAYDGQLFTKGLLLNTELEIQKLIEQSGDTALANKYFMIKQERAALDNLLQIPVENREMNADSLQKVIDNEERSLVESSKKLGDYTKNLAIGWQDVQKKLKPNDIAIEFATIRDTASKQPVYMALVLKKDMEYPKMIKLFSWDEFSSIRIKEYYLTNKLYNLVWNPLKPYLNNVNTVYFAPAGKLHTIGIEYLFNDDSILFAEKYNTYRLSSTRELAIEHTINPNKKATTYGGIQYNFSQEEWDGIKDINDSIQRNYRDIPQIGPKFRGNTITYLEGTKVESSQIADILRSAHYEINSLSDDNATEESFKMLSGLGIKILHIGTHGFYEDEDNIEDAGYSFYSATQQSDEDRSLSCSGLLFAGANSTINPSLDAEIPEGADDGVLTAKEISRLDFQGLDLVVLSACQTGLGEITGEGVFGLQRGFKKAGAQTIVMSLWNVADESTQLLMVEFFKNLAAGANKRAAFIAAQKVVRQQYPNPLYWAAFVMIDGI
ncbi:MAG: CHAT domain-containing protein [Bacteroidales bacterium]|nr:CHAT domain-containing protein [Bacteroidales bacterium]